MGKDNRKTEVKITISEPITLADLRWIVEETKDWFDHCTVTTTAHNQHNQFDYDVASITVISP